MRLLNRFSLIGAVLILVGAGTPTQAQEMAVIQATATVISSLTITGSNNLNFGSVTPGVNMIVARTSTGFAGEWSISGTSSAELSLTFTLPDSLTHESAALGMPVSFNSNDAAYSNGSGSQSVPNGVIDPNGPSTATIGIGGQMLIWIGGTVQPSVSQTGGNYSGNVTLTLAYTGG